MGPFQSLCCQLYGAARHVQAQEGLNYLVAPKGTCELKINWSPFWSFPLQIWSFLAFIIRKIPATFEYIFILLINTNSRDGERGRDNNVGTLIVYMIIIGNILFLIFSDHKRYLFCFYSFLTLNIQYGLYSRRSRISFSILITYKGKEDVFTDSRIIGIYESQLVHPVML